MILLIKIISTLLMISAVGLEIGNFYNLVPAITTTNWFKIIIWLASFALISHIVEGIIAAVYAYQQGLNPFKAGIYTFFTGTVGLVEVLKIK